MQKIMKILICFVLVFTFVFVQPIQKIKEIEVEAAGPLLVVVEKLLQSTAIKMGVDFLYPDALDKFSKTAAGEFIQKKTGINFGKDIEVQASNGFGGGTTDGGGAGRTLRVNVSPEMNAALVDEVADYAENLIRTDVEKKTKYIQPFNTVSSVETQITDPLHNTGINVTFKVMEDSPRSDMLALTARGVNYLSSYLDVHIIPVAFSRSSTIRVVRSDGSYIDISKIGGSHLRQWNGGTNLEIYPIVDSSSFRYAYRDLTTGEKMETSGTCWTQCMQHVPADWRAFSAQIAAMERNNTVSHHADGVVVTAAIASALRLPDNIDISDISKLDLPVQYKQSNTFEFDLPASVELSPVLLNVKQGDKIEYNEISNYFEKTEVKPLIVKNYNYNTVNVANNNDYYVSETQQTIINEQIVAVLPSVPEPSDPGGIDVIDNPANDLQLQVEVNGFKYCVDKESNMAVSCGEIEAPDASIFTYLTNAYDYGINAINTATTALASILDGSKGLVALYTGIFEWLPPEVTVILTSGLLLMIGLRVFRK